MTNKIDIYTAGANYITRFDGKTVSGWGTVMVKALNIVETRCGTAPSENYHILGEYKAIMTSTIWAIRAGYEEVIIHTKNQHVPRFTQGLEMAANKYDHQFIEFMIDAKKDIKITFKHDFVEDYEEEDFNAIYKSFHKQARNLAIGGRKLKETSIESF